MKLDRRLKRISQFVSKDALLVDIGCDHGWLGIYLLENKLVKYVYAGDIALGPLENVTNNIKKYHLEAKMEAILSDGLEQLQNINFTDVVIAGMGGTLIIDILHAYPELLDNKNVVLQPNVNAAGLRQYLLAHNFRIIDEDIIVDKQISYNIINAIKDGAKVAKYQPIEIEYGRHNLLNNNKLVIDMMKHDYDKYEKLLKKVVNDSEKHQYFQAKMIMIKEYLDGIE